MLKNDSDIPRDYCEVALRLAREREGGDKETPSARLGVLSQTGGMLHIVRRNLKPRT